MKKKLSLESFVLIAANVLTQFNVRGCETYERCSSSSSRTTSDMRRDSNSFYRCGISDNSTIVEIKGGNRHFKLLLLKINTIIYKFI
ncbi:MAG: hypothetical protein ABIO44_06860 [Saprospiraceae bacterium]